MPTDTRTPKHRLLDVLMRVETGDCLGTYITAERADGQSWRKIAAAVASITGEDIADQSLIDWFGNQS